MDVENEQLARLEVIYRDFGLDHALMYFTGLLNTHIRPTLYLFSVTEQVGGTIFTVAQADFLRLSQIPIGASEVDFPLPMLNPWSNTTRQPELLPLNYELWPTLRDRAKLAGLASPELVLRLPLRVDENYHVVLAFLVKHTSLSQEELLHLQALATPLGEWVFHDLMQMQEKKERNKLELPIAEAGLAMCSGLSQILAEVRGMAKCKTTVLITGETGVGKEMVADALHELSPWSNGPMIRVNCGAIPKTLLESLLFGYEKGAFTGAFASQPGFFEQANGGTLFLDEIGEMPLDSQVQLLRVLETKQIQRIGSSQTRVVDVRVLAATNKDLRAMVAKGEFREDLWYRLCIFPLHVPPLRERKVDIVPLARYFLNLYSAKYALPAPPEFRKEHIQSLFLYPWYGNVRELALVIERAVIRAGLIPERVESARPLVFEFSSLVQNAPSSEACMDPEGKWSSLENMMDRYIEAALKQCKGRISGPKGAAALLDMQAQTLRNRMKKKGWEIDMF